MCVSKRQCLSSLVPFSLTFHVPPQQLPVHEVLGKGSVAPATPERRKAAVPKDQLKSQEEEGEACSGHGNGTLVFIGMQSKGQ